MGVEHECFIPLLGATTAEDVRQTIANVLRANGISAVARAYTQAVLSPDIDIAVETDRSVEGRPAYHGIAVVPLEIKTRILTYDEWERIVPKTLSILRHLGADVNASCGHHIHIGVPEVLDRPPVLRSVYNLFHRYEPLILSGLVSPSRRQNGYCQPMSDHSKLLHRCKTIDDFERILKHHHKYYGLNLSPLFEVHPHCELRYWNATLNGEKARHLLRFSLQMIEHAVHRNCHAGTQVEPSKESMQRMLVSCGFRSNSRIYPEVSTELRETGRHLLLKRFRKYHDPSTPGVSPDTPPSHRL